MLERKQNFRAFVLCNCSSMPIQSTLELGHPNPIHGTVLPPTMASQYISPFRSLSLSLPWCDGAERGREDIYRACLASSHRAPRHTRWEPQEYKCSLVTNKVVVATVFSSFFSLKPRLPYSSPHLRQSCNRGVASDGR